jgi:hypothetical protein
MMAIKVWDRCQGAGEPPPPSQGHQRASRVARTTTQRWRCALAPGPSSVEQCVLSGGPYTVSSHVRQVHVVCPPPWPSQPWWLADQNLVRAEGVSRLRLGWACVVPFRANDRHSKQS